MVERVARAMCGQAIDHAKARGVMASIQVDTAWRSWLDMAARALEASHHAELVETLTAVRSYYILANPTKLTEAQVCDMVCGVLAKIGANQ
jgi:translation initiation factor 2B subunit (eIF-2B alpha/beta/delta family)